MPFIPALAGVLGPAATIGAGVEAGKTIAGAIPGEDSTSGNNKAQNYNVNDYSYGGQAAKPEEFRFDDAKPGEAGAVEIPGVNGMPSRWVKRTVTQAAVKSGAQQQAERQQAMGKQVGDKFAAAQGPLKFNDTAANQARGMQGTAFQNEQDVISGKAPSLAQAQLRQGQADATNMGRSMAAGAAGGSAAQAAALRRAQAMSNQGAIGANNQASLIRAQESAAARQNAAGIAGQMRGADEQRSYGQTTANAQNRLSALQGEAGTRLQFEGQGARANEADLQARAAGANARITDQTTNRKIVSEEAANDAKRGDALFGNLVNLGASALGQGAKAGSSVDMKTNIKPIGINPDAEQGSGLALTGDGDMSRGASAYGNADSPSYGSGSQFSSGPGGHIGKDGHQSFLSFGAGKGKDLTNTKAGHNFKDSRGNFIDKPGGAGDEGGAGGDLSYGGDAGNWGASVGSAFRGMFAGGGGSVGGVDQSTANPYSEASDVKRMQEQAAATPGAGAGSPVGGGAPVTWGAQSSKKTKTNIRSLDDEGSAAFGADTWNASKPKMGNQEAEGLKRQAQAEMPGTAGPSAAAASDRAPLPDMLRNLNAVEFNYKQGIQGEDPHERHAGIIAQDLEKTPVGASLVKPGPQGKMVDLKKATMANLAASSDLQKQVDRQAAELAMMKRMAAATAPSNRQSDDEQRLNTVASLLASR